MHRLALGLVLLLSIHGAAAQPATAPRVSEAETAFESGLAAYREGAYIEAGRLFGRAANDFGYNERTTAALLMMGRSAFAAADFGAASAPLTALVTEYPDSRYAAEARALLATMEASAPTFDLGVILPATGENGFLAQAMFNGVRLAVDDHNAANADRPVRLVFRDTEGTADGAGTAVRRALEAGADIILGPLFSAEAAAAAEVAEQSGAVLVAPLATDEVVAAGRRFVFQANPTFPVRGRQMARYAVERAGARNLAVVAESGTFGAVMADAFEAEATRLGATIVSTSRMRDAAGWNVLPELVGRERLRTAQAVYLPVTGGDAPEHAAAALRGLEEMSLDIQALGNTEWEGLDASRSRAGRFRAVFDQDFYVDDASAGEFAARYRALAGVRADRLALMGYDVARMVLDVAWPEGGSQASGAALADRLRAAPLHSGLGHRVHFDGGQVNGALFLMTFRGSEAVLVGDQ